MKKRKQMGNVSVKRFDDEINRGFKTKEEWIINTLLRGLVVIRSYIIVPKKH